MKDSVAKTVFSKLLPHVWAVLIFALLSVVYFAPVFFDGMTLGQYDVNSWYGTQTEAKQCLEQTGENPDWTNMMFGGMPTLGSEGHNVYKGFLPKLVHGGLPQLNAGILFFYMLGFYILLCALGCHSWLAILGSVAYALSTYNLLIIDAGHANKCWAMAAMAPIIGGVILCFKGKYWSGGLITLLFTGLHIMYSHQQITYYLLIMLIVIALAYGVYAGRRMRMKQFLCGGVFALGMALISLLPSLGGWLVTYDYSKDTMRGGAVLSQGPEGKTESTGLEKEYAFQWSYDKMESFTLLIPEFYGGSSHYRLPAGSETYQILKRSGQTDFAAAAPVYWGDQPFTSGPFYVGAVICFLFILGLFIVKGPEKWWLLIVTVLALLFSWGRHLSWFNDFMFDHLPLYNRFRTPSMILVVAEISMVVLAVLAIKTLIEQAGDRKKYWKDFVYAAGISAGICLFFALFGKGMFSFTAPSDVRFPDWLQDTLRADRASLLVKSSLRSFAFIAVAAVAVWAFIKRNLRPAWMLALLAVTVVVDLWTVDRKYVGSHSFVPERRVKAVIPTALDNLILADPDPDYRVFNVTTDPFNDANTTKFHKSVGGYSPIKMRRYQDMIDYHLIPGKNLNVNVLNMLNTKYFIAPDASGQAGVQRNVAALGHAWFVDSIRWVDNPDAEIVALYDFDPARTAVIDTVWRNSVGCSSDGFPPVDSLSRIRLVEYYPNALKYEYTASVSRPVVFSEVYYKTWRAFVDGQEVPLYRVNYILRGLTVPEGSHVIELKCKNPIKATSARMTNWGSLLNILVMLVLVVMLVRQALVPVSESETGKKESAVKFSEKENR